MSLTLDLPDLVGGDVGDEADIREFVNNSLTNIQTFFSRMIQLDSDEDELFGQSGRDVNGFRLTTEDEPDGVDHDTAISIRSDHISALGIQSGKESTSDSLLCMGTWDSTLGIWGVNGALRIDMSRGSAFIMESNFGNLAMNNISAKPALTIDGFNMIIITQQVGAIPDEFVSGTCALYVASNGELYAKKYGDTAVQLT
tara:strand:- start:44 stop:640 length:597 start_codon:yes stop_codon:yes gene_type:complete